MISMVIGIDPGKSGGIAVVTSTSFDADPMPVSSDGLVDCRQLAQWISDKRSVWGSGKDVSVWIEDVHAMPGQGVCSMFSFGRGLGAVEGVCGALGLAIHRVRPQEWVKEAQRVLGEHGVDPGASGKVKGKGAVWAKRIWPDVRLQATPRSKKDHDGMADALMIAWYGMRFLESKRKS